MTETSNLAVVEENSTLFEAILAVGAFSSTKSLNGCRRPAALVINTRNEITGFLDFRSILKSLEPKYAEIVDSAEEVGFSPERIKAELKKYGLWANALEDICKKAGEMVIRTIISVPQVNQIIDEDSSLNEALFQMMVTGNDYLFVKEGTKLAGIINLSDIVKDLCDTVKACRI